MTLRFSREARVQLLAAQTFLRSHSPRAAERFRTKSQRALSRLEQFPESGSLLDEFPDSHRREIYVAPYRFFYRVEGDIVLVVAVWHSAQIPDEPTG